MNKVLRATLVSAVVITTVIGIASFVLSFAALWDLATMAGVPRNLSWLWPVIVDGTILQATISVIALAQFEDQRSGRRFFWAVLVIAALVSIGANAMHAFISQAGTLHPALSAAIATVAPVSLLAATHGLGILVRIPAGTTAEESGVRSETPRSRHAEASGGDHGDPTSEDRIGIGRNGATESAAAVATPVVGDVEVRARSLGAEDAALGAADASLGALDASLGAADASFGALDASLGESQTRTVTEHRRVGPPIDSAVDPLDDVDRWILDEDRTEDLFPVDAP